jgi:hypothetical protein
VKAPAVVWSYREEARVRCGRRGAQDAGAFFDWRSFSIAGDEGPTQMRNDPLSTEKASTLDAQMAGRPKAVGQRRSIQAKGWSIYGAHWAQPVATVGKCTDPKTAQTGRSATRGNPRQRFEKSWY